MSLDLSHQDNLAETYAYDLGSYYTTIVIILPWFT